MYLVNSIGSQVSFVMSSGFSTERAELYISFTNGKLIINH